MKTPAALAALIIAVGSAAVPAFARSSYVVDDAHLLSAAAISQIDSQVSSFNAQTGKEVVVVTTTSLNGVSPDAAIEQSFTQQRVNGVEIFIAKNEHQIRIAGDRASSRFFPPGSYQSIAQSMRASFRAGDYDGGVENAVSIIINTYRGHASSLNAARRPVGVTPTYVRSRSGGGSGMHWILWIVILAIIFFIIRGIFRALSGPRYYGGGPGGVGGPGGYGGPGYGGPGYGGPGYGYGGGGGFWSGLLGGLGGAWLGNELFGGNRGTTIIENPGAYGGGVVDPGAGNAGDAAGWQNDAGQIDSSNIGGASWGDSGGGWGGGDGGGGGGWGGGDGGGGGGGGDSGGGW